MAGGRIKALEWMDSWNPNGKKAKTSDTKPIDYTGSKKTSKPVSLPVSSGAKSASVNLPQTQKQTQRKTQPQTLPMAIQPPVNGSGAPPFLLPTKPAAAGPLAASPAAAAPKTDFGKFSVGEMKDLLGTAKKKAVTNEQYERVFELQDEIAKRDTQTGLDRIAGTLTGAAKQYAGSTLNAVGTGINVLTNNKGSVELTQTRLAEARAKLNAAKAAGNEVDQYIWENNVRMLEGDLEILAAGGKRNANAVAAAQGAADKLTASGAANLERAKQDAGKLGRLAVDVGSAGAQMAGDVALAAMTGGSALIPMAVRSGRAAQGLPSRR